MFEQEDVMLGKMCIDHQGGALIYEVVRAESGLWRGTLSLFVKGRPVVSNPLAHLGDVHAEMTGMPVDCADLTGIAGRALKLPEGSLEDAKGVSLVASLCLGEIYELRMNEICIGGDKAAGFDLQWTAVTADVWHRDTSGKDCTVRINCTLTQ